MSTSTMSYFVEQGTSAELEALAATVGSKAQRLSLLALAKQRKQKEQVAA